MNREQLVRHFIRAAAGVLLAGSCLVLAACTSNSAGTSSVGQQGQAGSGQSGQLAGIPVKNGTVTVREGSTILCVMTVVNGKGTCKVSANKIGIGTTQLTGTFTGKGYNGSSTQITYSVTPASTATTLTLSPATVSYGSEPAEHLSVRVTSPAGGTPTGSVAVKYQGLAVCTIRLSGAKGSCTLPAKRIPAGTASLTAIYAGDHWYRGSVSATVKLTVTK